MRLYRRAGSPHWWFTVSVDGTRIRKSSKTTNKRAARRIAEAVFLAGRFNDELPRLGDVLARYYADHALPNKKSAWRDLIAIRSISRHIGLTRCNGEILRPSIARYVVARRKSVSAATINRELAILKCAMNKAEEWGMIKWRDMPRINLLPEPRRRVGRMLTDAEIQRLIGRCSEYIRPIVMLMIATGMRRGEAIRVKYEDISQDTIRIPMTKAGVEQFIPRPPWIQSHGEGYIFGEVNIHGRLRADWKKATMDAGLPGLRMHDLRHSFCSAVGPMTDAKTVQTLMRHSSLAMTQQYWHPVPMEAAKVAAEWHRHILALRNGHKKTGAPSRKPRRF